VVEDWGVSTDPYCEGQGREIGAFEEVGQGQAGLVGQLDGGEGIEAQGGQGAVGIDVDGSQAQLGGDQRSEPGEGVLGLLVGLWEIFGRCGVPGGDGGEGSFLEQAAAEPALHFAAGRLGEGSGLHQDHRGERDLVLFDDALAQGCQGLLGLGRPPRIDLLHQGDALARRSFDGERRSGSGRQGGMRGRGGRLQVLRIVVPAADDDQVLEPAGDEQLAVA
jgi:hypothetical protein